MKRCLVKADDYGFTEAISLGILKKAYREGIVRSTGVMVNMRRRRPLWAGCAKPRGLMPGAAYQHRRRKTGCHPALIPNLIDEQGRFPQL